jgi:hypothetical protein
MVNEDLDDGYIRINMPSTYGCSLDCREVDVFLEVPRNPSGTYVYFDDLTVNQNKVPVGLRAYGKEFTYVLVNGIKNGSRNYRWIVEKIKLPVRNRGINGKRKLSKANGSH